MVLKAKVLDSSRGGFWCSLTTEAIVSVYPCNPHQPYLDTISGRWTGLDGGLRGSWLKLAPTRYNGEDPLKCWINNVPEPNSRQWWRHLPGRWTQTGDDGVRRGRWEWIWGVLRLALQRIRQSQLRGPKRVIINYWWLPSLWKSGGRRHQMCRRGRGAKGLSFPSPKQCSKCAGMHSCLIYCFDAGFFSPFCFWAGTDAPYSPVLMRRTWWAFSFTQQEPSGGSLMARKATGDLRGLIGLHLCISTITLHFWFLTRNEWGGKVMYERDTVCISECMCYMECVCLCVCVCLQGGMFLCVCEAVMKGGGQGPTWPHEGSPNLHN